MIQAIIKQSNLLIAVDTPLSEKSKEQHILKAKFSEDWNNLVKTAVFVNGDTIISVALEDKCLVPWEVLENSGTLQIGITGTDGDTIRFTTTICSVDVEKSLVSDVTGEQATLEWWEIYYAKVVEQVATAKGYAENAETSAENAKTSEENSQKLLDSISDELKDFNTNVEEKTTEFNKVVETATEEYNIAVEDFEKLADEKESSLSDLSDSLTKSFNDNATEKTESFDNNASSKTTTFKKLVSDSETEITNLATAKEQSLTSLSTTQENSLSSLATTLTGEFNTNATTKTNAFDSNAETKTSDFNAVVTSANETIDGKVETVEGLAEDVDNAIVDYIGDRTALYDETEQDEPTVVDFVKANKDELEKARTGFTGIDYESIYLRLLQDFSDVRDMINEASRVPYSDTFINATNTYTGITSNTEIQGVTLQEQYYIQTVEDSVVQFDDGISGTNAVVEVKAVTNLKTNTGSSLFTTSGSTGNRATISDIEDNSATYTMTSSQNNNYCTIRCGGANIMPLTTYTLVFTIDEITTEFTGININQTSDAYYSSANTSNRVYYNSSYVISQGTHKITFTSLDEDLDHIGFGMNKSIDAVLTISNVAIIEGDYSETNLPVILDDGVDMPSYELTHCGKNLLPNYRKSETITNGVTHTPNSDGSISLSGTATSFTSILDTDTFLLKTGTYTLLSGIGNIGNQIRSTDGVTTYASAYSSDVTFSIEIDTEVKYRVVILADVVTDDTIYPQLELGLTASDYEPYTDTTYTLTANTPTQIPLLDGTNTFFCDTGENLTVRYLTETETDETTPNADFPMEMSSVEGDLVVKSVGKNLFDWENAEYGTGYVTLSGQISTGTEHYHTIIKVNPNQSYTISTNDAIGFYYKNMIFLNSQKTNIGHALDGKHSVTFSKGASTNYFSTAEFTTDENTEYVIVGWLNNADFSKTIQVELNITNTDYEEYTEDTTTYSDITLRSLPNGVCDKIEPITGTITRNIGIRDYADGDYELSNVYTDGTNTLYQLDTPVTEEISTDKKEFRTYDGTTNIFSSGTDVQPIISTNIPSNIGAVVADQADTIANQSATITEQASTIESLTSELSSVQTQSDDTDEILNELIGGESV